jgi:DNA-binding GntR family transcriptional regulator
MIDGTLQGPTTSHRLAGLMKNRAYSDLKRLILDETFTAGTLLSERQLAARLKMSKTPIKSALERLEAEGFIAVAPQHGIRVHDLSQEEVRELFEVRALLEPYVAKRCAELGAEHKLLAEQKALVESNLEATKRAADVRDPVATTWLDSEFHLLWCQFLGNREIVQSMQRLRDRIHRAIGRIIARDPGRMPLSYDEHLGIAEAIFAGDAELAARRASEHLAYGRDFLLKSPSP